MNKNRWPALLAGFPYAQPLVIGWQIADHAKDSNWLEYEQALDSYLESRDESLPIGKRYASLTKSRDLFLALAEKGDAHVGTSLALVRIHSELGDFEPARNAITKMLQIMPWLADPLPDELKIDINRPFLMPDPRFDLRAVEGTLGQWLQLAIVEALEEIERGMKSQ